MIDQSGYYHYTYRIESPDGLYYVGRHSTKNINDKYLGSGTWVSAHPDRKILNRVILEYYSSVEEVIEAEQRLLDEHIGSPLCKNINKAATGFKFGEDNPAKSEKERKRRSEENWMKTPSGREYASRFNPSKLPQVKIKRREAIYKNPKFVAKWGEGENHHTKRQEWKEKYSIGDANPAKRLEVREKISISSKKLVAEGIIPLNRKDVREAAVNKIKEMWKTGELSYTEEHKQNLRIAARNRPKVECPHCGKIGQQNQMKRYHFDNCKALKDK